MSASSRSTGASGCRRWSRPLAVLALASGGALAQVVSVPLAHLNHTEGTVAYAPQGDSEWHDVQPRRVLKRGDRLWTDRGSRAEVQAGGHALRLDGQTQIVLDNVSDTATQLSLTQGSLAATVTRVNPGDTFEVGTPNLAFRARQPGDYRIDADPKQGITRVVVLSGSGVVYGAQGEALEIRTGQRMVFRNRDLTRVHTPAFAATDDFDRWTAARRRGEPTVPMPTLAEAPSQPVVPTEPVRNGRTIVIPGNGPAPAGRGALATAKLPPVKAAAALQAAEQQPAPKLAPATALALPPAHRVPPAVPVSPGRAIAATAPAAAPLRVSAPDTPPAANVEPAVLPPPQLPPALKAQAAAAQAAADAQAAAAKTAAAAKAQAAREAREQAHEREREHVAQQRAERAQRAEREKRAALEARRSEDRKRSALAAKRAEEERRQAQARREQESKRLAARRAEEERRHALARRAAEEKEKKLAAARKAAEDQKLAEARRRQLARLQEQAAREEQAAQARREQQARKAEEDREKRDELARREEADRRQRALIEQARRDQERRDEEVWLRQQQLVNPPPMRPAPMGVPFVRRVS